MNWNGSGQIVRDLFEKAYRNLPEGNEENYDS
jgi:hypothetical protein